MNKFLFSLLVIFGFSCHSKSDIILNKPLPGDSKIVGNIYVADYANVFKCVQVEENKTIYSVYLKDSIVKTIFIFDPKFKTPEAGKIGDTYASLKNSIVMSAYIPGYVYEVNLKSGWTANFADNSIFKTGKINDASLVKYFTKRAE